MTDVVAVPGVRRLAKNTAVYAIADLIAKGGAYLLTPVLTRALGGREYGGYALVLAIVPVLTLIASLGVGGAVTRLWFDLDPERRKRFHASAWLVVQSVALGIAIVVSAAAKPLTNAIFSETQPSTLTFSVWTSFFLAAAIVPLAVLRAEEQPKRFAALSSLQFLGPAVGVLIALAMGADLRGALWGHLAGSAAVFLMSIRMILPLSAAPPAWSMVRPALALGLPIVPHLVAHWALNVANRPAIERTLGLASVGFFAVGYQIAQGVSLIATAVNNATVPTFYRAAQQGRRETLGSAWTLMLFGVGIVSAGAALFGEELVTLLAAPEYRDSYRFIPWVSLGYWFLAAYYFPVNALFFAKKVGMIPVATAVAAIVNYMLNIVFLERYGLMAAAWATAISYAILLLIVLLAAQRAFPLPYRYGKAAVIGALGTGIYLLSTLLPHNAAGSVAKLPLLAVFAVAGFAVVRDDVRAMRPVPVPREPSNVVVLAAATMTQARSMAACGDALRAAGLEPRYVSLDPILGKSAAAGFREMAVAFIEAPAAGGMSDMVLRGRGVARSVIGNAAAVVIGNDFTPFERLLIEQARASGTITVLLQDGVIALDGDQAGGGARSASMLVRVAKQLLTVAGFPFEPKPYGAGGCDVICVYGASTKRALVARGAPADTIHVTGQPRYDALEPKRTPTLILVTTQPFSRYGLATPARETQTFAAMIDAALNDGGGRPVVVKLHPDTDDAGALQERFRSRVRFEQTSPIESLYQHAAALVTLSSTTALEAMLFDIPVVVVDVPGFPTTLPYLDSGAVVPARSLEEIGGAIRAALTGGVSPQARASFLNEHLAPLDGHAAVRVADAVRRLVAVS